MSATHYPLTEPLYLSTIGTLIGVYEGREEVMYSNRNQKDRHVLYRLQLIAKDDAGRPVITDKGRAYLDKLATAAQGITLTPKMTRVEWV